MESKNKNSQSPWDRNIASSPAWNTKKNMLVVSTVIVVFLLTALIINKEPQKVWSQAEKESLCKAYVGELFTKKPSIITPYKYKDGITYVSYIRESDRSIWRYSCMINGKSMVWSGYVFEEWGRWRDEDAVEIYFDNEVNKAAFQSPIQGGNVIIVDFK